MDNRNSGGGQKDRPPVKKFGGKYGFVFFIAVLIFFVCFMLFTAGSPPLREISYSAFVAAVENNEVAGVQIVDNREIRGAYATMTGAERYFVCYIPYADSRLMGLLEAHNVVISGGVTRPSVWAYLLQYLPWIIGLLFMFFIFRQSMGQGMRAQQFARGRIRKYDGDKKYTFADVAGQEEAKYELREVVEFLKNPKKFIRLGAKIPKGVLLVGNPGTGKTLLARAVAGEAGVSFFHMSGSDFVEMFVGVGASRVRDLFDQARKNVPCIIFIDELDAVGRARGTGYGGGHDEREQTLNQMLVEMDGFESKDGVIVLAATNRPDVLDPALLRPGRFDRQVHVPLPDIKEREAIIAIHARKVPLGSDVNLGRYARATSGLSGADLANMVNEAALFAARQSKNTVENVDFEEARDKILMGVARKSMVLTEKEKIMTAVHEAGHGLPYYYLKNSMPLHKITIIPRGNALGLTLGLPEEDMHSYAKSQLLDRLVIMFGGYAAESVVYGETTTGTQNDIQQATALARRMVCEWGMSAELGAVALGEEEEPIFIGKEIARHKDYSEQTAMQIDSAVKELLDTARETCFLLLTEHRNELDILAAALVERETLDDSDVRILLNMEIPSAEKKPLLREKETAEKNTETAADDIADEVVIVNQEPETGERTEV